MTKSNKKYANLDSYVIKNQYNMTIFVNKLTIGINYE